MRERSSTARARRRVSRAVPYSTGDPRRRTTVGGRRRPWTMGMAMASIHLSLFSAHRNRGIPASAAAVTASHSTCGRPGAGSLAYRWFDQLTVPFPQLCGL
ncbi:MAG: hypothetical protein QXI55_00965 [Thermofilum sp.]